MTHTDTLNRFLAQYGRSNNTRLSLKSGVCVLVSGERHELAVVELPPESDAVLLHSKMHSLKGDIAAPHLKNLLALNFEMNAMRGCWLALDADDNLRLCSQMAIEQLNASRFAQYLDGFITQSKEVREFVTELYSLS